MAFQLFIIQNRCVNRLFHTFKAALNKVNFSSVSLQQLYNWEMMHDEWEGYVLWDIIHL